MTTEYTLFVTKQSTGEFIDSRGYRSHRGISQYLQREYGFSAELADAFVSEACPQGALRSQTCFEGTRMEYVEQLTLKSSESGPAIDHSTDQAELERIIDSDPTLRELFGRG